VWSENRNEGNSVEQQRDAYDCIQRLLNPSATIIPALPPQVPVPLDQQIQHKSCPSTSAHVSAETDLPSHWKVNQVLGHLSTSQLALQFEYAAPPPLPMPPMVSSNKKRKAIGQHQQDKPQVQKRKKRSCPACHLTTCRGAFMGRPCETVALGQHGSSEQAGSSEVSVFSVM
jgi:hypothetical protein